MGNWVVISDARFLDEPEWSLQGTEEMQELGGWIDKTGFLIGRFQVKPLLCFEGLSVDPSLDRALNFFFFNCQDAAIVDGTVVAVEDGSRACIRMEVAEGQQTASC